MQKVAQQNSKPKRNLTANNFFLDDLKRSFLWYEMSISIYIYIHNYLNMHMVVCLSMPGWLPKHPKNDSGMFLKTFDFPNMQHTLKDCLKSKSKHCPGVRGYQGIAMLTKVWTILGVGITRDLKGFQVVTLEVMVPLKHIIVGSFKGFWFTGALCHLLLLELLHSSRLSEHVCVRVCVIHLLGLGYPLVWNSTHGTT